MNKVSMMVEFVQEIQKVGKLTSFIKEIFNYDILYDYNYIFRITQDNDRVIMDIYDNVSDNRFNRYIFIFDSGHSIRKVVDDNGVFVSYIYINGIHDPDSKILKLGYLFNLKLNRMVEYADTFLDKDLVKILTKLIKRFTYL